jgi:phosphoribosylglycinamide formyltransferase-1
MPLPAPLAIGFLASHGGSNMQAILDAIAAGALPAEARIVICNNSGARALERARAAGVPGLHLSAAALGSEEALDRAMLEALRGHGVGLVVCAGYMRKVGPRVLAAYARRVLNIHPALLPRHGGKGMYGIRVHEAVLAAGERETGVTVHLVDEVYDHGPIVAQARVPVQPGDTPEALQARVLQTEHRLYPETLRRIALGEIDLDAL